MEPKYTQLKYACYTTNITMSVVGNLSPLLFLTFRSLYDISYSLLGLLILINFVTQLTVDLAFSFFSHKFNIQKAVKITPLLAIIGLLIYAIWPMVIPTYAYVGLVIGTLFFSAASGFCEVLISPIIAAIPAKNPEREMSKLHSIYAWGVVFVVIFSTIFLQMCGSANWYWLAIIFTLIPLTSLSLYLGTAIPALETPKKVSGILTLMKNKTLWFCVLMIFFGGASEVAMAQWSSSFLEQALGISKIWGDVFGVALFAVMLGLGRTLYSKIGRNITKVLLCGIVGATICYGVVAICNIPLVGVIACAFTGFCVSMLWPGSLVVASDRFPESGVFIYAMMAAGGDLGASIAPQLIGVVTDMASIHFASEQLGMKSGMFIGMLFPLLAIPLYIYICIKQGQKLNKCF